MYTCVCWHVLEAIVYGHYCQPIQLGASLCDAFVIFRHGMLLVSYKPASNESNAPTSRVPIYIHVGGIRNYIDDEVF